MWFYKSLQVCQNALGKLYVIKNLIGQKWRHSGLFRFVCACACVSACVFVCARACLCVWAVWRARGPFKGLVVGASRSHPALNLSYLSCVARLSGVHLFLRWLGFGSFRLRRILDLRYLTHSGTPLQHWLLTFSLHYFMFDALWLFD